LIFSKPWGNVKAPERFLPLHHPARGARRDRAAGVPKADVAITSLGAAAAAKKVAAVIRLGSNANRNEFLLRNGRQL
jgi:hypothetical protein